MLLVEFNATCKALKNNNKNQYKYFLSGTTSNYGVCSQAEVDDKFVALNCQQSNLNTPISLRSWPIRTENIVSGGYEKKNLLKEITAVLKKFTTEKTFQPKYNPADAIIKKATYISKVI